MGSPRRSLVAVGSLLGMAAFVFVVLGRPAQEEPSIEKAADILAAPASSLAFSRDLHQWDNFESGDRLRVVYTENGPVLADGTNLVPIAPQIPGLKSLRWSRVDGDHEFFLVGLGQLGSGKVWLRWRFAQGNPQATFEWHIEGVTPSSVGGALRATLLLPEGDVEAFDTSIRQRTLDSSIEIPPRAPAWVRWTSEASMLTFSELWSDGARIERQPDGTSEFIITLWEGALRGNPDCAERSDLPFRVTGRFVVTVGSIPAALSSPHISGALATVVPVFRNPVIDREEPVPEGATQDGPDAVARMKGLLFGHSDAQDPRYTNGGLLGSGLGATIELPDRLSTPSIFDELIAQVDTKRIQWIGTGFETDGGKDAVIRGGCEASDLLKAGKRELVIAPTSPEVEAVGTDSGTTPLRPLPSALLPSVPGGSALFKAEVVAGTLPSFLIPKNHNAVQDLIVNRSFRVVAIPLLATRNPLLPAARYGLLQPERHGHWVVDPEFASVLTEMEMQGEADHLSWSSALDAARFWIASKTIALRWNSKGELEVSSTVDVAGATLVVGGTRKVELIGASLRGRRIREVQTKPQTWFWFDLKANQPVKVVLGIEGLDPVYWEFDERFVAGEG